MTFRSTDPTRLLIPCLILLGAFQQRWKERGGYKLYPKTKMKGASMKPRLASATGAGTGAEAAPLGQQVVASSLDLGWFLVR